MWHIMWLTTLSFVCYLSAINCVDPALIAIDTEATAEAMGNLQRFGYLERGPQDSSYSESVCTAESFRSAIEDFQSFAGLKKTGEIDNETCEVMSKPRCGVPDRIRPGHSSTRQKRFVIQGTFIQIGSIWPKKQLTYKIKNYTPDMSQSDVDREIARAFQMWADVADVTFVHVKNPLADVDINIIFASGEHDDGNCDDPFNDGPNGILAHAAFPSTGGYVHFDESETWTLNSDKGTNLFQVATHEFGHVLGLRHSHVRTAVMYHKYEYYRPDFKLDKDDIQGIQTLYGENQLRKLEIELKAKIELLRDTVNDLVKSNTDLNNKLEIEENEGQSR
ncbi:matrix metalloproteinase-9-like [Daphnia pulex]|uniref:matrix metalloproteinase-9-like n=1 Tax=Daphnia pulex TaxID=6669 RepID=UPI001EDE713B|nr:matrix metalloproteinase-9-like [Daphnia pulex]